jgi:hypothetical protein
VGVLVTGNKKRMANAFCQTIRSKITVQVSQSVHGVLFDYITKESIKIVDTYYTDRRFLVSYGNKFSLFLLWTVPRL